MAETLTAHYGWTKPDPGASATTWGSTLNATTDKIDAQVYINAQGVSQNTFVGEIKMWAGTSPPNANWMFANGVPLSRNGYPVLFAVIGYTFGGSGNSFNLPNFNGRVPAGVGGTVDDNSVTGGFGLGQKIGVFTHVLSSGEMPQHNHGVNDAGHNHGVNDPTHTHGVSDPTHSHAASQDSHNHSVSFGMSSGYGVGAVAPPSPMINQGSTSATTSTAQPAVHISGAGTGIGIQAAATGVSIQAHATGISIQNAGGNSGHINYQPVLGVNFIIRVQ